MQTFEAEIKKVEDADATYVEVPYDVEAVFGSKRVKVKAWFDGVEYRGSIVRMSGCYMLILTQAIRRAIGKGPGDTVAVEVVVDEEERIVEAPEDLSAALESVPEARLYWDRLSFSAKKDYADWIADAKKEDTRARRIHKAIVLLSEKKKLK